MIRDVFCDESRPTGRERYLVIGGVTTSRGRVQIMNNKLAALRESTGVKSQELKWTKVSASWLDKYRTFVDYFFDELDRDCVRIHCLIVDRYKVDHKKFNAGDCELGFYKFYYQLLLHCFGKPYGEGGNQLRVFPDRRGTSYNVSRLRDILNNGVAKKFNNYSRPFLAVQPQDSKAHDLIQLADILIGAIGYQKNRWHLQPGASSGKRQLMAHIARRAGVYDLGQNTLYFKRRFTVWNLRLQEPVQRQNKGALLNLGWDH